jgi:hypothetical protein
MMGLVVGDVIVGPNGHHHLVRQVEGLCVLAVRVNSGGRWCEVVMVEEWKNWGMVPRGLKKAFGYE